MAGLQVLHLHASGDRLASCSADGEVLLWSLSHASVTHRWRLGAYCLHLTGRDLLVGGEGVDPLRAYDLRSGAEVASYGDSDPPLGVTSSLQRTEGIVAAGNTFSRSQLRVWDPTSAVLTRRFHLPTHTKGVRCMQVLPRTIIAGCANGWILLCDLRTGRFEKRLAHSECVNALHIQGGNILISAGDDGIVKLTDVRTFGSLSSHKLQRIVSSAVSDSERLYSGCDDGVIHSFDYSIQANRNLEERRQASGSFTAAQQQALMEALKASRARQDSRFR